MMACEALGGVAGVEKVWSLPRGGPNYAVVSSSIAIPASWKDLPVRAVERVVLRDRWGKLLLGHKLSGYRVLKMPGLAFPRSGAPETLGPGLDLVRCRQSVAGGVVCQMSDGSELACTGVLFADGARSRARELMDRSSHRRSDSRAVACWCFVRPDPLDLKSWEFRTALGKSVELLPLPEGRVRVKMRFRAPNATSLAPSELSELFSEFGPDVEALLEGVGAGDIACWDEENPAKVAFSPLPGTFAVGQAALGSPVLESFDWALRLARSQMERVIESLLVENWEPEAWEPLCQEALRPLLASERYLRAALHYDNVFLRPLRDFALRWLPAGILVERVKGQLEF